MSEGRKDVNAELTDEAVEQATGGVSARDPQIRCYPDFVCPRCGLAYPLSVITNPTTGQTTRMPPRCFSCAYDGPITL